MIWGASIISCNRTSNERLCWLSQLLKQCFVTHMLLLSQDVVDLRYSLSNIIYIFMTTMMVMNLFNKKINMNIKC